MALVVYDRIQETTATTGTGTLTLSGAVAGYQTFAVVGNGNTTFYCIVNNADWEVGIGTYSTTGPTLARTTVLSNSNGNTTPLTLVGASNVFCTYPAEKSVNLDASGNVTPLGTISSGTWQGTTVGVAYGGTGVTSSSGASSVMLRDANQNTLINHATQSLSVTTSAAGTTTLTAASSYHQVLIGTTTQTYKLPDATTLPTGFSYLFDNDSTGALYIVNNASGAVDTVAAGGYSVAFLEDNSTVAGTWGRFSMIPNEVNWGTNSLDFGGSTILTNGIWQGTTIASGYGGTGLTTFTAANYALYSTSASALTAGTLPVAAGGTGNTSFTAGYIPYGNGTGALSSSSGLYFNGTNLGVGTSSPNSGAKLTVTGTTSTASILLTSSTTSTNVGVLGTNASWLGSGSSEDLMLATFGSKNLTFGTNGTERMRIDSSGNVGIGTSSPASRLNIKLASSGDGIFIDRSGVGAVSKIQFRNEVGAASTAILNVGSSDAMAFETGGSVERMRIDSSGNLLVGTTTSPTVGTNTVKNFVCSSDISIGSYLIGVNGSFLGRNSGDGSTILNTGQAAIIFSRGAYGGTTESMRIFSSGGVSIGNTTDPGATNLSVTGTITGSSFSGAGTGLTGTAASLSIGGTAANATTLTGTAGICGFAVSAATVAYGGAGGPQVGYGQGSGAAMLSFHRPGFYAVNLGLDTDNQLKVGGWSMGAVAYVLLNSNNYNSYAPTLTGTGASGTWPINISGSEFAAGTTLVFYQAGAPTGWTQVTTQNDAALRVVSAAGGGTSGGTVAFSTAFAATNTTDGTAITTAQLPAHNHGVTDPGHTHTKTDPGHGHSLSGAAMGPGPGLAGGNNYGYSGNTALANTTGITINAATTGITTANTGSGTAHSHTLTNLAIKYINTIICSKN